MESTVNVLSTGSGLIGFGDDAIDAYVEEGSTELEARRAIFNTFRKKTLCLWLEWN